MGQGEDERMRGWMNGWMIMRSRQIMAVISGGVVYGMTALARVRLEQGPHISPSS